MPGNFVFKPRLTSTFPSSTAPRPQRYPHPPAPSIAPRPRGIVPHPPAAPRPAASTHFPVMPVRAPAREEKKYVSSTHYGRYVLWQGRQNSELVISSHGSHVVGDRRRHIVPPRTALHFYGPDYAPINTHLVDQAFIRENVASHPYEIRSAGHTYLDYELSKIQVQPGKEKGETYNHIIECLSGYDLVTIEQLDDDGPYEHMLLSELIAHLRSKGHQYAKIHCFFCRSLRASDLRRHPSLEQFVRPAYVVR